MKYASHTIFIIPNNTETIDALYLATLHPSAKRVPRKGHESPSARHRPAGGPSEGKRATVGRPGD